MESLLASNKVLLPPSIGIEQLLEIEARAASTLAKVRGAMLAPTGAKTAPIFNTAQLAAIIGEDKPKIHYRLKKGDLPSGTVNAQGTKREWTLAETRIWANAYRKDKMRPAEKAAAATICIANFKGGVAKTTTTATLAQGLSIRGHKRILLVDLDPQGSLSELFGRRPSIDVNPEDTVLGLFQGVEEDLSYAVRPTYWDGIDLVAAAPIIFDAEFALPARQMTDSAFEFWAVLDAGLDALRDKYDVIIIDTPPSLSYSTINALMAADGIVIPLPPNTLDFASSAQFWRLFLDIAEPLYERRGISKMFNFINVLMTRVDNSELMANETRRWIMNAYGDSVLPIEIPKTSIASTATSEFGTAYDVGSSIQSTRTWKRAHDAYERFVDLIEEQLVGVWASQVAADAQA